MCNIFCKQEFFLSGFKNEAMFIDTITKQDLEQFRIKLINDIKGVLKENFRSDVDHPIGYKTGDARKMLNCSNNKLVALRISRKASPV